MIREENRIRRVRDWIKGNGLCVLTVTVLLALLYGNYAQPVFSQDSYAVYVSGRLAHAELNLSAGRFVQSLFSCALNEARHPLPAYLLSVAFLSASFCAVYFTLVKNIRRRVVRLGAFFGLLFLFAGPFYCDWFEYATKLGMTGGVLLASLASVLFYRIQSAGRGPHGGRRYALLAALLFLAAGGYQASLNYFVAESAMLCGKLYHEDPGQRRVRAVLRNAGIVTAAYCLEGALTYGFLVFALPVFGIRNVKITPVSAADNLREIAGRLPDLLLTNQGMMPRGCFAAVLAALFLLFVWFAVTRGDFFGVFRLFLNLLMVFVAPFGAWLVSAVWMAPRTLTVFLALPGMVLLDLVFLAERAARENGVPRRGGGTRAVVPASLALAVFLLSVYAYRTVEISGGLLTVNALDQNTAAVYCAQIEEYEEKTGRTVATLAFPDHNGTWFHYDGVISTYDTNISAFSPQWSRIGVMRYVSGRAFAETAMDRRTYETYFGDARWDAASPEQVVCDGDTAYIAVCGP